MVPSHLTREVSGAGPHPGSGESAPAGRAPQRGGHGGQVPRTPGEHRHGLCRHHRGRARPSDRETSCESWAPVESSLGHASEEVLPRARARPEGPRLSGQSWRRKGLALFDVIWVGGLAMSHWRVHGSPRYLGITPWCMQMSITMPHTWNLDAIIYRVYQLHLSGEGRGSSWL